jgi:hypothetical protein
LAVSAGRSKFNFALKKAVDQIGAYVLWSGIEDCANTGRKAVPCPSPCYRQLLS